MFMVFKKKQMFLTALVVMLGVAGYLNYRYDKDNATRIATLKTGDVTEPEVGETVMVTSDNVEDSSSDEDYFATERLQRNSARQKAKAELEAIVSSESASTELVEETRIKIGNLALNEEKEITAENLLAAKGFKDTLVYITSDSVTVTVKRDALSRSDTAKIVDVIFELTQNNNIKIVEVE